MTKFKRHLVPGTYLTAADMLSVLSQQQLKAAAVGGQVLLVTQPPLAWLLDSCCMGRPAKQAGVEAAADGTLEPQLLGSSISNSSGGGIAGGEVYESSGQAVATAVLGVAGLNVASEALLQQYRQHQQQLLAQQLRRGGRVSNRRPATAAAAVHVRVGEGPGSSQPQELCLWQLSHQEAAFLSHVLGCCQVFAAGTAAGAAADRGMQQGGGVQQGSRELGDGRVDAAAVVKQQEQQEQQPQEWDHAESPPGMGMQQQQQPQEGQPLPAGLLVGDALWQWCCDNTTGGAAVFAPQYAAYHHLRALGWLPLPGLSYGADYVLYQLHPELAHSDFVVTVMVEASARCAAGGSGLVQPTADHHQQQQPSSTQLAWLDACIMQRLARQVLKEMLLLYVVVPPGLSLLHFDCVHSIHVREVLVQRWVPSEHRDNS